MGEIRWEKVGKRDIERLVEELSSLPDAENPPMPRMQAIELLAPAVDKALLRGYSLDEIAERLTSGGFSVTPATLRKNLWRWRQRAGRIEEDGAKTAFGQGRDRPRSKKAPRRAPRERDAERAVPARGQVEHVASSEPGQRSSDGSAAEDASLAATGRPVDGQETSEGLSVSHSDTTRDKAVTPGGSLVDGATTNRGRTVSYSNAVQDKAATPSGSRADVATTGRGHAVSYGGTTENEAVTPGGSSADGGMTAQGHSLSDSDTSRDKTVTAADSATDDATTAEGRCVSHCDTAQEMAVTLAGQVAAANATSPSAPVPQGASTEDSSRTPAGQVEDPLGMNKERATLLGATWSVQSEDGLETREPKKTDTAMPATPMSVAHDPFARAESATGAPLGRGRFRPPPDTEL